MKLLFTEHFVKGYEKLPPDIQEKVDEKLKFLLQNLRHPSLRVKKIKGLLAILLSVMVLFVAGGCQKRTAAPTPSKPSSPNLFKNPGFEQGEKPWFSLTTAAWGTPFQVTDALARSGKKSAYLKMRSDVSGTQVFGVVQENSPNAFPEVVSGYYRVEKWQKAAPLQYLQFVVIAMSTDLPGGYTNHQIRYILGGINEKPYEITNAKFLVIGPEEPPLGKWIYFKRNVAEDFKQLWGAVPKKFSLIRVLFETRYEQKTSGEPDVIGDVYYDDLYIGPKQ